MNRAITFTLCICVLSAVAAGQFSPLDRADSPIGLPSRVENVRVRAIASHLQARPGEQFHVALEIQIADGWIYYSIDPGPIVQGATLSVQAEGLEVGRPLWAKDKPKRTDLGAESVVNFGYEEKTVWYVPIRVPADASPGERRIVLTAGGQICREVCINVEGLDADVSVQIGPVAELNPQWTGEIAAGLAEAVTAEQLRATHIKAPAEKTAPKASVVASYDVAAMTVYVGLGLALLAGLTLNIMPCVLPIIPLRILSLVAMAHESRRRFVTLGLAFAGGMMLFFIALAGINAFVRLATDQAISVSDHFQYPAVRITLAMILVALAANLFGAFNVIVPSKVAGLEERQKREGHAKSVGMGLMMAVLATPCSFAFLLAAMAWAQMQPLWLGTMAILLIGVGMAAPHAILAAFPSLVQRLPKPGRWMELFKQTMGFALLPVAIWLIGTLGGDAWPFWVAAWGVVLAFCLWMGANWVRFDAPWRRKWTLRAVAATIAIVSGVFMLGKPAPPVTPFEPFDAPRLEAARAAGRTVLVKVTAAWCTECKVIDYRVYGKEKVAEMLTDRNVLTMKADVTDRDSAAAKWARENLGPPPITMIYGPGQPAGRMLVGGFSIADLEAAVKAASAAGP